MSGFHVLSLNRMLELLRSSDKHTRITLTRPFLQDLKWFQTFLPQFNGTAFFNHPKVQGELTLDVSLVGLGTVFENGVYAILLTRGYLALDIVHQEMGRGGKHILIHCDNSAVVSVLNTGKT